MNLVSHIQYCHLRHRGVEHEPLLVLGVEVEVLHLLLAIEQTQADLVTVRGPTAKLKLKQDEVF